MSKTSERKFEGAALAERTPRETVVTLVRSLAERVKTTRAAYAGGLPAERESCKLALGRLKQQMRATVFGGFGRRIDLAALLGQKRRSGEPKWALVDPLRPVGWRNGQYDTRTDGVYVFVGANEHAYAGRPALVLPKGAHRADFRPVGMPALPQRVREIATDPRVRKHARWVGVAYQPEEWLEAKPDPALVVEWAERPGEYYVLAVWGGDRPELMEFVD